MLANKIQDLLNAQGDRPLISIAPDANVFDAVICMVENNVGSILVIDNGHICGIMSERDYLRFVTVQGRTARDTPVHQLMTRKIVYATPDTSLTEVMAIMTKERIRHVPIMADNELKGIVSIGDVVKQMSQDQTAHIQVLEEYITDAYPGPALDMSAN